MKVLIIRFSSLGDIVLLSPLFREIKRAFPQAQVDFLTASEYADIHANSPHIMRCIGFRRRGRDRHALIAFARELSHRSYDLVLDAHSTPRSRLLCLVLLGWRIFSRHRHQRIDKRTIKRNFVLRFKRTPPGGIAHQRRAYLDLLRPRLGRALPHGLETERTELFIAPEQHRRTQELLPEDSKPYIAIGAGAAHELKCWPKEYFKQLIEKLTPQYNFVLLGTRRDLGACWLSQKLPAVHNLLDKTSPLETAAVLQRSCLAICNDSSITHLAEAVGVPVIVFFGPTHPAFGFAPFLPQSSVLEHNLSCRPCSRNGMGKCNNQEYHQCMRDISVARAHELVVQTLKQMPKKMQNIRH